MGDQGRWPQQPAATPPCAPTPPTHPQPMTDLFEACRHSKAEGCHGQGDHDQEEEAQPKGVGEELRGGREGGEVGARGEWGAPRTHARTHPARSHQGEPESIGEAHQQAGPHHRQQALQQQGKGGGRGGVGCQSDARVVAVNTSSDRAMAGAGGLPGRGCGRARRAAPSAPSSPSPACRRRQGAAGAAGLVFSERERGSERERLRGNGTLSGGRRQRWQQRQRPGSSGQQGGSSAWPGRGLQPGAAACTHLHPPAPRGAYPPDPGCLPPPAPACTQGCAPT